MWLKRFTHYLLNNRWMTLAFTFVITFVPIIGILGIIIAALVTLTKSITEGAILTVAATLPYLLSFYLPANPDLTIPLVFWAAIGVAVLSNILTWVFAAMLRRGTNWSAILQIAALLGVLVVSVIHLAYPSVVDWWGTQLNAYYTQAAAAGLIKSTASAEAQLETITTTKYYATGLMVAGIILNALLQLIVARWWQATVFHPGSLRRELHRIRLTPLAGILFIVSLAFSYLGNSVVLDIMPILYLLFTAAGLSLVHYLFVQMRSKTAWFWLALLYIMLIFSLPTSMLLISVLALMDIWLDIRKRLKKI